MPTLAKIAKQTPSRSGKSKPISGPSGFNDRSDLSILDDVSLFATKKEKAGNRGELKLNASGELQANDEVSSPLFVLWILLLL